MKALIIAMDKEAEPILRHAESVCEKTVCGKRIINCKLFGENLNIVICGVGKVNAACAAQYAIDALKAEEIINIGYAGALNKNATVGEIVNIFKAVQYDFDLTQINGTEIGTLDECAENYMRLCRDDGFPQKSLATGDRFNDSETDFNLLTQTLKADVRDMEGAAIAQVCMHAHVNFYAYKVISDIAGSGSTTAQYLTNLKICAEILTQNAKRIILREDEI